MFKVVRVQDIETYWRSGDITPFILDLSSLWRWVVCCTLRPLRACWNICRFTWDRMLCGPHEGSGEFGEFKTRLAPSKNWTMIYRPSRRTDITGCVWIKLKMPSCILSIKKLGRRMGVAKRNSTHYYPQWVPCCSWCDHVNGSSVTYLLHGAESFLRS